MAWFTRYSRYGDVHMCYSQETTATCGLACAVMAAFKINKLQPGNLSLFSEKDILNYKQKEIGSGPITWVCNGLDVYDLYAVLNEPKFNMTGWKAYRVDESLIIDQLVHHVGVTEGKGPVLHVNPAIVSIEWNNDPTDSHWILIDTIRRDNGKLMATVCDPIDGSIHMTKLKSKEPFLYHASQVEDLDFWGDHYEYSKPVQGRASVRCEMLVRST